MYAAGCGLILTLIAHILVLLGLVLSYEGFWRYLFFGLFVVWFAAIVAANSVVKDFKQRDFWKAALRGCPNWMKYMCYFFIGYAFLYFLLAMATSASSGSPNAYRVLSASLLSFYSVATAILYSAVQVREHDETRRCPNGHPVSPSAIFCEQCGTKIAVS
jgi:hypothetical protein